MSAFSPTRGSAFSSYNQIEMGILHKLIATSLVITVGYGVIVLLLCFPVPQRLMIYLHWVKLPNGTNLKVPELYGFAHNKVRNIHITSADNVTLGAWHILPTSYYQRHNLRDDPNLPSDTVYDAALSDPSYDTVLYLHGNALHRAAPWRTDLYKRLGDKFDRLNIIAIDYRGFGDSEGIPSEEGLRLDALATVDWLFQRNVSHDRISLIGHSLGTGVATTLAYDMTKRDQPPNALILKAAYSSLPNLIFEYRMLKYIAVLSPVRLVPPVQKWLLSHLLHVYDSVSRIEYLECPILLTYGASDVEIPGHNSQLLFHRAVYGQGQRLEFAKDWVDADPSISRRIVPNEATVYKKDQVHLVKLHHADHNNVGYYDYMFQAMADITGWHQGLS
ncbi:Alpha/Beta hydrolase protein [Zychaea mexicana]|uniref:Alpha/Beta hydrolase protein n=1 Tax=Zychaea mexicana TaxID=64656 RepID=UPI0022FDD830|nr:Alpha/Beta hydrolase protein [Zychaea mexicana]KAI9494368.1 Alpha/Beta hydrolase protein [Zychaea mexicana]